MAAGRGLPTPEGGAWAEGPWPAGHCQAGTGPQAGRGALRPGTQRHGRPSRTNGPLLAGLASTLDALRPFPYTLDTGISNGPPCSTRAPCCSQNKGQTPDCPPALSAPTPAHRLSSLRLPTPGALAPVRSQKPPPLPGLPGSALGQRCPPRPLSTHRTLPPASRPSPPARPALTFSAGSARASEMILLIYLSTLLPLQRKHPGPARLRAAPGPLQAPHRLLQE